MGPTTLKQQAERAAALQALEDRFAEITTTIEARTRALFAEGKTKWTRAQAKEIKSLQDEAAKLLRQIHAAKSNI